MRKSVRCFQNVVQVLLSREELDELAKRIEILLK